MVVDDDVNVVVVVDQAFYNEGIVTCIHDPLLLLLLLLLLLFKTMMMMVLLLIAGYDDCGPQDIKCPAGGCETYCSECSW